MFGGGQLTPLAARVIVAAMEINTVDDDLQAHRSRRGG